MTVKQLINTLRKMPEDKIVVVSDSDGVGWDNIGEVIEGGSTVTIEAVSFNLYGGNTDQDKGSERLFAKLMKLLRAIKKSPHHNYPNQ